METKIGGWGVRDVRWWRRKEQRQKECKVSCQRECEVARRRSTKQTGGARRFLITWRFLITFCIEFPFLFCRILYCQVKFINLVLVFALFLPSVLHEVSCYGLLDLLCKAQEISWLWICLLNGKWIVLLSVSGLGSLWRVQVQWDWWRRVNIAKLLSAVIHKVFVV